MSEVVRTDRQFEVRLDDDVAFAEYQVKGDSIVFPHTVVPPAFEGHGIGTQLVEAGLAYAKEQGLLVRPHCSFFRAYIKKRPELRSLVHPDERAALGG